jgi:membrane protein DedA with SNARE-associated domain
MSGLWEFVLRHGYGLLFVVVLVEQLGVPVPAVPVLLIMGALAGLGFYSISVALSLAVVAALMADVVWFQLGRRRGDSILGLLCKLSLEPDSCVKQTTRAFDKWGPATLLTAKFVPGLSTVAPPLAGSSNLSLMGFLAYDGAGSLLWAGTSLGAGFLLRREVEAAFERLSRYGGQVALVMGLGVAGWIGWKVVQRRRAMRDLRVARISPSELHRRMEAGEETRIVDLRSPNGVRRAGAKIAGASVVPDTELDVHLRDLPAGAHLVFYCS